MRQRLTVEQLHELNDVQKTRLREWWKPQLGDFYIFKYEGQYWHEPFLIDGHDGYHKYMNEDGEDPIPLMSIGQMIEFLWEKTGAYHDNFQTGVEGPEKQTFVDWEFAREVAGATAFQTYQYEPCDALWDSVKFVLEGE